ncbi:MAG: hypothetical protein IKB74_00425 [Lentisphaeria bacterium]|nr:hypothetical protein [Lentisphaeria bacterium]
MEKTLDNICAGAYGKLKNFQKATVDRICELFKSGQRRVLVADEVGLGKTIIARSVTAETARMRFHEGDDLFKVVYVCSNQTVSRQNIRKLQLVEQKQVGNLCEMRLSMQHLRIAEDEAAALEKKQFIQMLALTPGTSFQLTESAGCMEERALTAVMLQRLVEEKFHGEISEFFRYGVGETGWNNSVEYYRKRVDKVSGSGYPERLLDKVAKTDIFSDFQRCLTDNALPAGSGQRRMLTEFRKHFAAFSAESLAPDLVIMDEFQRFRTLLSGEGDMAELAKRFLQGDAENSPRVLLLSATPFKLYSTLEEAEASGEDQYREFKDVVKFLHSGSSERFEDFQTVWGSYSALLHAPEKSAGTLLESKNNAEKALYDSGICRTERIGFISGDKDFLHEPEMLLDAGSGDICSFLEMSAILAPLSENLPVDYVKSAPFLLSFMEHYQLKENITKNPECARLARNKKLQWSWLDTGNISRYGEIPRCNAKLDALFDILFRENGDSSKLLWVPPSKPDYELQGVFKNQQDFSKILIFSAWEMVPRMIAVLTSYEAERRSIGTLIKAQIANKKRKKRKKSGIAALSYNVKHGVERYPGKRVTAGKLNLLLWDSKFLAACFTPSGTCEDYSVCRQRVFENISQHCNGQYSSFEELLSALDGAVYNGENRTPLSEDFPDILTDMALASPAVCARRTLQKYASDEKEISQGVFALAAAFAARFCRPESVGAVCSTNHDIDRYQFKLLRYCAEGGFQAMLDEYFFVLQADIGAENWQTMVETAVSVLKFTTAVYDVDTRTAFASRIENPADKSRHENKFSMRSHFAASFNKDKGGSADAKSGNRKESLRTAFNSPFYPFVLASTSVGQEGLDFHTYCRKIMHWNLPANPVELEQREGRINRFQCFAIRRSLVAAADKTCRSWKELFDYADEREAAACCGDYSQMSPFWCMRENQPVKIERLVPLIKYSSSIAAFSRLKKLLTHYRLTLGQQRQQDIAEAFIGSDRFDAEFYRKLFLQLSPYKKQKGF